MLTDITPFVLTWNEEENIGRCLNSLAWVQQILVLDSGSTDRTREIAQQHPGVRFEVRPFDSHSRQANYGLGLITTGWVLALDADYLVPADFIAALREDKIPLDPGTIYFLPFTYCIFGRPLRSTLLPPRGVLFARAGAVYDQDGHTQLLRTQGRRCVTLPYRMIHDDRKPFVRWLSSQQKYAVLELEKLWTTPPGQLSLPDKIRLTGWLVPLIILPYVLLGRGLLLDGPAGWYYAFQRLVAETLLALLVLEAKLTARQR